MNKRPEFFLVLLSLFYSNFLVAQAVCDCVIPTGGLYCDDGGNGVDCPGGSSVSYDSVTGTYTLVSENCYSSTSTQEKLAFAGTQLCGDGELIVKVNSISPSGGYAGIMMRKNRNTTVETALLYIDGSSTISYAYRFFFFSELITRTTTRSGIDYLRLKREGSRISWYVKSGNGSWDRIYDQIIYLVDCPEIGMITSNHSGAGDLTVTATFSEVQLLDGANNPLPDCPTSVAFAIDSTNVNEGESVQVCLNISNASSTVATNIDVALSSTGNPHFDDFTTQSISFPGGSSGQQCFTLQTDAANGVADNNFSYTFALQNISGGNNVELGAITDLIVIVNEEDLSTCNTYAGENQSVCASTCVELGCADNDGSSYCFKWLTADGVVIDQSTSANPTVCPTETTTYKIYVMGEDGLVTTEEVTIEVNC